jgi:O-antigen/teichoic acid export membrane protein
MLALFLGVTVTVSVLAIASRPVVGLLGPVDIGPELTAAFGIPLCAGVIAVQVGALTGLEKFRDVSVIVVVRALGDGALMVIGSSRGVEGALLGLSIGEIITALTGQVVLARGMRTSDVPFTRLRAGVGGSIWQIAVPSLVANLSISLATVASQVVLVKLGGGFAALGVFAFAYRWYLVAVFLTGAISPVTLTMLANESHATGKNSRFGSVLRLNLWSHSLLTLVPAMLVGSFAAQITEVGGRDYRSAAPVIVWLAIASVPTAFNNLLSQAAISMDLIRKWLVSDIALGFTLFAVTALLATNIGPTALGVAYSAAMLLSCVVLIGPIRRTLRGSNLPARN